MAGFGDEARMYRAASGTTNLGSDSATLTYVGNFAPGGSPVEYQLDGVGDYGSASTVGGTTALSFGGWWRSADWTTFQVLLAEYTTSALERRFYLAPISGRNLRVLVSNNGMDIQYYTAPANTLPASGLVHIGGVFDGATQTLKAYVNGTEITGGSTVGAVPTSIYGGTTPLAIGARDAGDQPLTGSCDDIRIWRRVVTAAEWAEWYAGGVNYNRASGSQRRQAAQASIRSTF